MKIAAAATTAAAIFALSAISMAQNPEPQSNGCHISVKTYQQITARTVPLSNGQGSMALNLETPPLTPWRLPTIVEASITDQCPHGVVCYLENSATRIESIPFWRSMDLKGKFEDMTELSCFVCDSDRDSNGVSAIVALEPPFQGFETVTVRIKVRKDTSEPASSQGGYGGIDFGEKLEGVKRLRVVSGPPNVKCAVRGGWQTPEFNPVFMIDRPLENLGINFFNRIDCYYGT